VKEELVGALQEALEREPHAPGCPLAKYPHGARKKWACRCDRMGRYLAKIASAVEAAMTEAAEAEYDNQASIRLYGVGDEGREFLKCGTAEFVRALGLVDHRGTER
jgi:hypothetical protein